MPPPLKGRCFLSCIIYEYAQQRLVVLFGLRYVRLCCVGWGLFICKCVGIFATISVSAVEKQRCDPKIAKYTSDSSRVMQGADSTQRSPIFNYSPGMIANEALQRNCKIAGRGPKPNLLALLYEVGMPVPEHQAVAGLLFSSILCRRYAGLSWVRSSFLYRIIYVMYQ